MELEHLNKTQIILLTTLVAFVSSIATSIVTVTLMDQAPPGTTTTIRNVVERTVERVVQAGTPKETVKTVIVREEDLIADAVDKQSKALARIFVTPAVGATEQNAATAAATLAVSGPEFVAVGFVVSDDGTIVTDSGAVSEDTIYAVKVADGTTFDAKVVFQNEEQHVAFLKPVKALDKKVTPADMGDSNSVRLGVTAIVVGGKEQTSANVGIVSGFDTAKKTIEKEDKKEDIEYRSGIHISIGVNAGEIILSGSGLVIAMGTTSEGKNMAVPVNVMKDLVLSIPAPKTQ
ncbi:MAG: serine protease [Patescibacteria group bacterium]